MEEDATGVPCGFGGGGVPSALLPCRAAPLPPPSPLKEKEKEWRGGGAWRGHEATVVVVVGATFPPYCSRRHPCHRVGKKRRRTGRPPPLLPSPHFCFVESLFFFRFFFFFFVGVVVSGCGGRTTTRKKKGGGGRVLLRRYETRRHLQTATSPPPAIREKKEMTTTTTKGDGQEKKRWYCSTPRSRPTNAFLPRPPLLSFPNGIRGPPPPAKKTPTTTKKKKKKNRRGDEGVKSGASTHTHPPPPHSSSSSSFSPHYTKSRRRHTHPQTTPSVERVEGMDRVFFPPHTPIRHATTVRHRQKGPARGSAWRTPTTMKRHAGDGRWRPDRDVFLPPPPGEGTGRSHKWGECAPQWRQAATVDGLPLPLFG